MFEERLRSLIPHGPIDVEQCPQPVKEPENVSPKQMRVFTVKDLYRMPMGHSGDIPRHCQTCKKPPTQFAVVYSDSIRFAYFFCDDCFTIYVNKPLPEKEDGAERTRRSNNSKSIASGGTDASTPVQRTADGGREPLPGRTTEITSCDSGLQQEDGGVEASGFSALEAGVEAVTELLCSVVSEI